MPLLTDAELAAIRADIADLLPDTCTILHPTYTNTDGYGDTVTWGTAVASASCRFDPDNSPDTTVVADRDNSIARFIVTLQYNENVNDGDRLRFNNQLYEITSLHGEHSARGAKRVRASLIRGA